MGDKSILCQLNKFTRLIGKLDPRTKNKMSSSIKSTQKLVVQYQHNDQNAKIAQTQFIQQARDWVAVTQPKTNIKIHLFLSSIWHNHLECDQIESTQAISKSNHQVKQLLSTTKPLEFRSSTTIPDQHRWRQLVLAPASTRILFCFPLFIYLFILFIFLPKIQ